MRSGFHPRRRFHRLLWNVNSGLGLLVSERGEVRSGGGEAAEEIRARASDFGDARFSSCVHRGVLDPVESNPTLSTSMQATATDSAFSELVL